MTSSWLSRVLLSLAGAAALAASPAPSSPPPGSTAPGTLPADLARPFDYDPKPPIDLQQKELTREKGAILFDVSYASPKDGRVTAYLVVPSGKGPFAGILFGHWGPGDRREFLPEAMEYARAGAVSLLVDYPWVRPAPWRRNLHGSGEPEHDRDLYIQAVVDLRRGFDVLLAQPGVDPKRIGYVGHSFGAQFGAILTAVDRRMQTTILVGGVPDAGAIYLEGDDPDLVELRTKEPERIRKHVEVQQAVAAVRYVPYAAPIPLFFQFARLEEHFGIPAMERYYAAASEPKSIAWYWTGHALNDPQALADRTDVLRRALGLRKK